MKCLTCDETDSAKFYVDKRDGTVSKRCNRCLNQRKQKQAATRVTSKADVATQFLRLPVVRL